MPPNSSLSHKIPKELLGLEFANDTVSHLRAKIESWIHMQIP